MPSIRLETFVGAGIDRVFDLACSIDLHTETMTASSERAVGGVTTGLIGLGQSVTWEAVHFGFRQRLTSKIVICDRPHHLRDVMVKGAFAAFTHDHHFSEIGNGTLMTDVFDYRSPLGPLGSLADALFLKRYMTKLLAERNRVLKEIAEGDSWQKFIPRSQS
ncbi:MAG: SRPBCC family protein [Acidobacteriota bacterium]